ncbi:MULTISPECIES: hypothetical protein [Agrobacterium tumefaciens complex]|uniref:hypothetical protein n=1 Tax=Agrobacterium tumefaciens complex TaxID=1183400 RepID=UPI0022435A63|nr:hypothetical protein [Agrobacterium tumefaciens]MCW8059468.1 hypothetical protein [Agrobacterium tumefaciens]MCW8146219.1 hypothetical protein [Agrobacterium tumefaciens]
MTRDKIAIYTVIIGDGYVLPPVNQDPEADYFCFTDQPNLYCNGWELIRCDPILPVDLPRSSREQKLRPHRYLQSYQRSIYVDPSVRLTAPAEEVWQYLIPDDRIVLGCFWHSFRETLSDEFDAVRAAGIEHPHILSELHDLIEARYVDALSSRPLWGGFLARRHMSPLCIEVMEQWFAFVLRYSRRDQLTMPLAASQLKDDLIFIRKEEILHSPVHRWPIEGYKRPDRYYVGYGTAKEQEAVPTAKNALSLSDVKTKFRAALKQFSKW